MKKYLFALLFVTANLLAHDTIKTVIFDFGGVVATVDREKITGFIRDSFHLNPEQLQSVLKAWKEVLARGADEHAFWTRFAANRHLMLPDAWFDELNRVKTFVEIPETMQIVQALQKQGYQTVMLSNVQGYQSNAVKAFGYSHYFNPVFLSYEMGVEKPHPDAYKIVLQRLGVSPEAVLFIDNTPENVEAARKLGIESILFTQPGKLREDLRARGILL